MKHPFSTVFLMLLLFCNCRNDDRSGKQYNEIADKSAIFRVTIQAMFPEDDVLSLYYTTDGSTNFAAIKPIWKEVKSTGKSQEIVFNLPEKTRPTELRIDFGKNQSQQNILLKKITMSYHGKSVELPGTLIFSYFRPDFTKTAFNATKATVHGIVKNGIVQSPSLYPKECTLSNEIKKLLE